MTDAEKALLLRSFVEEKLKESSHNNKPRLRVYPGKHTLVVERSDINQLAKKHGITGMELIVYAIFSHRSNPNMEFSWRSPRGPMEIRIN